MPTRFSTNEAHPLGPFSFPPSEKIPGLALAGCLPSGPHPELPVAAFADNGMGKSGLILWPSGGRAVPVLTGVGASRCQTARPIRDLPADPKRVQSCRPGTDAAAECPERKPKIRPRAEPAGIVQPRETGRSGSPPRSWTSKARDQPARDAAEFREQALVPGSAAYDARNDPLEHPPLAGAAVQVLALLQAVPD